MLDKLWSPKVSSQQQLTILSRSRGPRRRRTTPLSSPKKWPREMSTHRTSPTKSTICRRPRRKPSKRRTTNSTAYQMISRCRLRATFLVLILCSSLPRWESNKTLCTTSVRLTSLNFPPRMTSFSPVAISQPRRESNPSLT